MLRIPYINTFAITTLRAMIPTWCYFALIVSAWSCLLMQILYDVPLIIPYIICLFTMSSLYNKIRPAFRI